MSSTSSSSEQDGVLMSNCSACRVSTRRIVGHQMSGRDVEARMELFTAARGVPRLKSFICSVNRIGHVSLVSGASLVQICRLDCIDGLAQRCECRTKFRSVSLMLGRVSNLLVLDSVAQTAPFISNRCTGENRQRGIRRIKQVAVHKTLKCVITVMMIGTKKTCPTHSRDIRDADFNLLVPVIAPTELPKDRTRGTCMHMKDSSRPE